MATPDAADVLGGAGACPEVVWKGKTWRIGRPVQLAKDWLTKLVAAKARENVEALKDILDPAEYAAEREAMLTAIRAGHHKTWGRLWLAMVDGPDGGMLFLLSLVKPQHPEATEADVLGMSTDEPFALEAAVAQVCPDFFTVIAEAKTGASAEWKAAVVKKMTDDLVGALKRPTSSPAPPTT